MIKLILLCLIICGCASIEYNLSSPPDKFTPNTPTTVKELSLEWQGSLIKIKEWQSWYDIQVGSNYFYTNIER